MIGDIYIKQNRGIAMINKDFSKMNASQEASENSAKAIYEARSFMSAIDMAVKEYFDREGDEHLKGKGKPIKLEEGDVLHAVLKNANILPPWLELRKEIILEMKDVIEHIKLSGASNYVEQQIDAINLKIRKYNRTVPHPQLQRGLL